MDNSAQELQPKEHWIDDRFENLCKAIAARYDGLNPIPLQWIEEYNELTALVSPRAESKSSN